MKAHYPPLNSFGNTKANSSYSNVKLTRHNYRGPSLHPHLRGAGGSPSTVPSPSKPKRFDGIKMPEDDEEWITAAPVSSSDEESPTKLSSPPTLNSGAKRKSEVSDPTKPNKRTKMTQQGTRASKRIRAEEDNKSNEVPSKSTEIQIPPAIPPFSSQGKNNAGGMADFDDIFSSQMSSQGSRRAKTKTYGRANLGRPLTSQNTGSVRISMPEEVGPRGRSSTPEKTGLKIVDDISSIRGKPSPGKKFKLAEPLDDRPSVDRPSPAVLTLPDDLDSYLPDNSRRKHQSHTFELPILLSSDKLDNSDGSSELSDLDSLASHELDDKTKEDLKNGSFTTEEPLPPNHVRCPICRCAVDASDKAVSSQLDKLQSSSIRAQEIFCHTHRKVEAISTWKLERYPTIDWSHLETTRVPSHLPHLRQILYRKTSSHYLDHLESQIAAAKGNQTRIKHYLLYGIVDVVKTGYYGPRGAKVISQVITETLSKQLSSQLRKDKLVRQVGVSGFVSAVLLPELTVKLVMEDMHLDDDEEEARRVLNESSEVGALLNPDDDHVQLEDADEDEDGGGGTDVDENDNEDDGDGYDDELLS